MVDNKIKEEFQLVEGNKSETKVRAIHDKLANSQITHQNYERFSSEITTANSTIDGQIESLFHEYVALKEHFQEDINDSRVKQAISDDGVVPAKFVQQFVTIMRKIKEMESWRILQTELLEIATKKLITALSEAKAFDIQRDALKEMREQDQRRNENFLEMVKSRDGALISSIQMVIDRNRVDMRENTSLLADSIIEMSKYNKESVALLCSTIKSLGVEPRVDWHKTFESESLDRVDGMKKKKEEPIRNEEIEQIRKHFAKQEAAAIKELPELLDEPPVELDEEFDKF